MTLDQWHTQERARLNALYDRLHVELQARRRQELARLELGVQMVARDWARQRQEQDDPE